MRILQVSGYQLGASALRCINVHRWQVSFFIEHRSILKMGHLCTPQIRYQVHWTYRLRHATFYFDNCQEPKAK